MASNSQSVKISLAVEKALASKNLNEFKREFNNLLKELGKTDEEIKAFNDLATAIDKGTASLDDMDAETADLMRSYKALEQVTRDKNFLGIKSHKIAEQEIEKVKQAYQRLKASGKLTSKELAQAAVKSNEKIRQLEASTNGWSDSLMKAKGELAGLAATGAGIGYMVKQAIDYESAMADVAKVVDGTGEQVQQLSDDLLEMSQNSTLSATELASIAAAGGQLGVPIEHLKEFVSLSGKMATAFNMSADEAGQAVAKLTNVFGLTLGEVESLSDSINMLGNNTAATERDIIDAMVRVGGTSKQFGLAAEETAALTGALIALGKPPEVAATSINVMLSKMQTATVQSQAFQEGLDKVGMSAEQLAADIQADPQRALQKFLETLKNMDEQARAEAITKMFGQEHQAKIAALVGSLDQYNRALELSTNKAKAAGAMQREYEARMGTTAAQLDLLGNTLNAIAINVGTVLLPPLNSVVSVVQDASGALAEFTAEYQNIAALGTALVTVAASAKAAKTVFLALKLATVDLGSSGKKAFDTLNVGLDAAFEKGTRLKSLFSIMSAAWLGWEIGSYLRKEFSVAEKAGIAFTGTMHAAFRKMQGYWEAFEAVFTDDTIDDAMRRMDDDIAKIEESYQALFDEVDQRMPESTSKQQAFATAAKNAGAEIKTAAKNAENAGEKIDSLDKAQDEAAKSGDALATAENAAAFAVESLTAKNAILAASHLARISNAKTEQEVANALSGAVQALSGNTEALAAVSEAAANKTAELSAKQEFAEQTTGSLSTAVEQAGQKQSRTTVAANNLTAAMKDQSEATSGAGGIMAMMIEHLRYFQDEMDSLSEKSRAAFDQMVNDVNKMHGRIQTGIPQIIDTTDSYGAEIQQLTKHMMELRIHHQFAVNDVERWMLAVDYAASAVKVAYYEQSQAADNLIKKIEQMGSISEDEAEKIIRSTEAYNLLDDATLDSIISEVERLRSATEALEESALSTLSSLQDELDRMEGDLVSVEQRKWEQEREKIEKELERAREMGDEKAIAALEESLRLLDEIHIRKMEELGVEKSITEEMMNQHLSAKAAAEEERPPLTFSSGAGGGGGGGGLTGASSADQGEDDSDTQAGGWGARRATHNVQSQSQQNSSSLQEQESKPEKTIKQDVVVKHDVKTKDTLTQDVVQDMAVKQDVVVSRANSQIIVVRMGDVASEMTDAELVQRVLDELERQQLVAA